MEAENENLAMQSVELSQNSRNEKAFLIAGQLLERRRYFATDLKRTIAFRLLLKGVEAGAHLLARSIDNEMTSDRKEPGFEFRLAVVLRSSFQHAHPRFLKKVFGQLAATGEIEQITQQPM